MLLHIALDCSHMALIFNRKMPKSKIIPWHREMETQVCSLFLLCRCPAAWASLVLLVLASCSLVLLHPCTFVRFSSPNKVGRLLIRANSSPSGTEKAVVYTWVGLERREFSDHDSTSTLEVGSCYRPFARLRLVARRPIHSFARSRQHHHEGNFYRRCSRRGGCSGGRFHATCLSQAIRVRGSIQRNTNGPAPCCTLGGHSSHIDHSRRTKIQQGPPTALNAGRGGV